VPLFVHAFNNLTAIIDKAVAHAEAHKFDPQVLVGARLYPDMFPFWLQVQSACDHAKNVTARLSGDEMPIFDSTVQTFDGLKERIGKTLAYIAGIAPERFDGADKRVVKLNMGGKERTIEGLDYFLNSGLPNFYFHLTTAYGILRHNGVEIGKRDFIG
jgi:hypothetical protein